MLFFLGWLTHVATQSHRNPPIPGDIQETVSNAGDGVEIEETPAGFRRFGNPVPPSPLWLLVLGRALLLPIGQVVSGLQAFLEPITAQCTLWHPTSRLTSRSQAYSHLRGESLVVIWAEKWINGNYLNLFQLNRKLLRAQASGWVTSLLSAFWSRSLPGCCYAMGCCCWSAAAS